jgi:hypothetical protein
MACQEWIILLAGSSHAHNQPKSAFIDIRDLQHSQVEVELRSIIGQGKHKVHETGPLSHIDVEHL